MIDIIFLCCLILKILSSWSFIMNIVFLMSRIRSSLFNIDDEWKSFYIKKLLDHHLHHYKCDKQKIKYLVKWTDYRSEFNEWYEENLLDNTIKLMLEYKIHQNNDSDHITYFHKLLIKLLMTATKLPLKKQHCKSKQMT